MMVISDSHTIHHKRVGYGFVNYHIQFYRIRYMNMLDLTIGMVLESSAPWLSKQTVLN